MRALTHHFAIAPVLLLMGGCSGGSVDVPTQIETVYVQGKTNWMELKDMRMSAERHLRTRYPDFDPAGADFTASLYRGDSTNMVTIQYFRGFGLPAYYVTFDASGQITDSTNRIATEYVQP